MEVSQAAGGELGGNGTYNGQVRRESHPEGSLWRSAGSIWTQGQTREASMLKDGLTVQSYEQHHPVRPYQLLIQGAPTELEESKARTYQGETLRLPTAGACTAHKYGRLHPLQRNTARQYGRSQLGTRYG